MRIPTALGIAAAVLVLTGCQDPGAPAVPQVGVAFAAAAEQETGPSNECYGAIASRIATTWPWAHADGAAFPPPPGALALWVETFGPVVGVSSVRELQFLFCS